jgi:hypothetical protein
MWLDGRDYRGLLFWYEKACDIEKEMKKGVKK